jgi:hypothetical protein
MEEADHGWDSAHIMQLKRRDEANESYFDERQASWQDVLRELHRA